MFPKVVGFPPKSPNFIGISIINHPFWGIPLFLETSINFQGLLLMVGRSPVNSPVEGTVGFYPIIYGVLFTSNVVGLGISEPSTVCSTSGVYLLRNEF